MQVKFPKTTLSKISLIVLAFMTFDIFLNFTLYNPQFITPLYGLFLSHHMISTESPDYPVISISSLNHSLYSGPRAAVIGTVQEVIKSGDGDWHINIQNKEGILVTEIIPEYSLPVPSVGDTVKIWGITRYDIAHRWWELHPVIGWEKLTM